VRPDRIAFLASPDAEGVEAARRALKQHIAFYSSTRTYHAVLEFHGWEAVGAELHQMSKEGRWKDMPALITDEMIDEWALVATAGELAATVSERCAGLFDTVLLDLPPDMARDDAWVAETIAALHAA